MTLNQMRLFYKTIENLKKSEMKENIIASLAGARYDNEALDRIFNQLE